MLLNTKSKDIIKEKLKISSQKHSDELKFKKIQKDELNIDDIYTFKHTNLERSEKISNNLPYDTEISSYLPNIDSLIYSDYNNFKKEYYYNFKLKTSLPEFEKATIVIYKVNDFNTKPFLMFLLYEDNGILSFIERRASGVDEIDEFVEKNIFSDSEEYPLYKGYKILENKCYLFYELTQSENEEVTVEDFWKWGTLYEILNIKSIFDKPIDNSVTKLFINFNELTRLTKEDDMILHEVPMICYYKCNKERVNYISKFGAIRETPNKNKGPYYYFDSMFKNVVSFKKENERIIRFAVFTGKTYLTTNYTYNEWMKNFNSLIISEKKLYDENEKSQDKHPSLFGLKIIPSKNNKKYDSSILSPIFFGYNYKQLPLQSKCIVVVKQLEQQLPLSIYIG